MNIFDSNDILEKVSIKDELSIVVITYKRLPLLKTLIETLHVAINVNDNFKFKIILCINGYDNESESYLRSREQEISKISTQIISLSQRVTPAEARNIATVGINTEWMLFLDDDVEVPVDLFKNFANLIAAHPNASLWGGPNLTPFSSSLTQQKIGYLLQNYLVTGPISSRYKFNNIQVADCQGTYFSLCNIFIKTMEFRNILFNDTLKTAEENELIYKMARQRKTMKTSDLLFVWHSRRESIPHFMQQIKNYGFGRGQLIYNGHTSFLNISLILVSLLFLSMLFVKFPFLTLCFLFFWLIAIFANLIFKLGFKEKNIMDLFLPLRLWGYYFIGIIIGIFSSYRANRNSDF
ncbi:glycosyltransferase [bacterium]|nr:glycosyltransferase [bacterium]